MPRAVIPNPKLGEEMRRRRQVAEDVSLPLAQEAAELYRDSVPVGATGALQAGVFAEIVETSEGFAGRVGNTAPHAGLVELGTVNNPPDGSLRRAVEAVGMKVDRIGLRGDQ